MNAEQKQQAKQLIADWTNVSKTSTPAVWFLNGDCMAGFLQELVDAPTQEPIGFAVFTGNRAARIWFGARENAEMWRKQNKFAPELTALYTAPPAPSVTDAELVPVPRELLGAACYAIKKNLPAPKILAQLRRYALGGVAAPTPSEPPADVARDAERYRWLRNPEQEVGLVLDKRVGFRKYDEGTRTGGYPIYEYSSGDELDAAVDAAIAAEKGGA